MSNGEQQTQQQRQITRQEVLDALGVAHDDHQAIVAKEQQDFISPWERRLKEHGWPVVLLVIPGICAWRTSVWIAPRAEQALDKHIELLDTLKVESPKQTAAQKESRDAVDSIDKTLQAYKANIDLIPEIHKRVIRPNDKE